MPPASHMIYLTPLIDPPLHYDCRQVQTCLQSDVLSKHGEIELRAVMIVDRLRFAQKLVYSHQFLYIHYSNQLGKPLLLICGMDMVGERKHVGDGEPSMHSCLQCSSKFKRKFTLTRHIKSVHNPEKIKCEHCESSFGRKDDLARHKRRKHTLQKCEECEFSTYKNHELGDHMMDIHPPDNYNGKKQMDFVKRTFKVDGVKFH